MIDIRGLLNGGTDALGKTSSERWKLLIQAVIELQKRKASGSASYSSSDSERAKVADSLSPDSKDWDTIRRIAEESGMTEEEIAELIESIENNRFLSKMHDDETEYLISLFGGCVVDLMLRSPEFLRGLWIERINTNTGETVVSNNGKGFAVSKDAGGKWTIEIDYAVVRSLMRAKNIMADEAAIDKMTRQTVFKVGLRTLGDILLGEFESGKSGGVITPYGDAELRNLVARLTATIGSGLYPDEDEPELRKPSLIVNGDSEFSDNLSSPEFISGFLSGKGWAIQKKKYINAAGEEEDRWIMEIDNLTVRNILRVYELVISQLRGENDNYVFAAMAEVHHYDPLTGRVWLSTEGGKIYMPFRVGDYIMVQRFQPGNDVVSGGDGYITKHYELIITDCGSGGQVDENGDRLDWVLFKNFTTQMVDDMTDPSHDEEDYIGTYYTDEEIGEMQNPTMMAAETLIAKGDTFCRVDNESDIERKGLMTITSVGPSTPYMDVIYGLKTDPGHYLKSRFGNLEGIKTDLFGWLEGFGAYINNLYGVGKFFNAQTGESMESRIEATNERMRSVYKETLYDVGDADNKVSNGFFQDDLEDWTPVDIDGAPLDAEPEMAVARRYTDPQTGQETADWRMENADGDNQVAIKSGDTDEGYAVPLLMNGLQLQIQRTLKAELSDVGGVRMLHLRNSGVAQDFSVMDENTSHKRLTVDDEEFENPTKQENKQPEYEKTTYKYWENYYRDWLQENWARLYPGVTYEKCKVDEIITSQTAVEWINSQVNTWSAYYENQVDYLTSTEDEADKLYLGIRILPLTEGRLRVGFLTRNGRFNEYQDSTQCFSKWYPAARDSMKWELATWNDHHDDTDDAWYYPCDADVNMKSGRLFVGYTGECYIRFVVLSNDPIEESEHEYETLFEQNSRRIRMQAKKDEQEFADWVIQHNAIAQRVTDNRNLADNALKDILGIEYDENTGMYKFPNDWFDSSYTYGSWLIHTKSRIDFLFTKFDDKGNLIGYSNHTQTADYISNIIASGSSYPTWAVNCLNFAKAFLRFSNSYYDNSVLKNGVWLTATADYSLTSSEVTTIKALFQSNGDIQKSYTAAANKISEIPSDIGDLGGNKKISDPEGRMLIVNFFNMVVASRYSTVKSSVNSLSADSSSNVNMNNSTFLNLKNMEIPQMEEACRELVAMIVNRYGEQKLGANIQIVQEGFKAYQDSLDDAIKDAYEGQNVDFVSWARDTALSSVQAKAIIDKKTGKIKTESIKTQTAELIQNAINNYGGGKFSDYSQTDNGFQSFVVCLKNDRINFANFETAQGKVRNYLEDNILNKSEYEAVKKLRMSMESEYKDITATYTQVHGNSNLPGKDNNQSSVKGKIYKAYSELSTAYTNLDTSLATLIAKYEEAISTNNDQNISITVSATLKNNVNTYFAAFNEKLTAYQKALDEASNEINKATAQGLVNQLKAIINTDVLADDQGNYAYAGFTQTEANKLANIFGKWEVDSNGNPTYLKGYSTTQQTADMISASVISQNRKTVSLADTSVWEQGATDGESAGKTYEQVKITSNNRIRTKSLIPVTKDTVIELTGSSFMVGFVCFGLDMKISSDAWKGWYSYNSANLTLKNTISDSTKYVAILLRYTNSASISASNVTSSGIKLTNTEVISSSEVQQTAENIMTTVKNYKTGGYSILTQTANAIKAVVDEDYIEGLGFATSDDLSSYYTKEELKIGGNAITSVVQGLQEKTVSIAEWEQGSNANTIQTTSHIPVNSTTKFYLNKGYTIYVGFYNASDTYISGSTTGANDFNRVNISIPSDAATCQVQITRTGGISPKQISSTGFRMTDTTIVTSAEISSFVSKDANGYLESGIKLRADQISITTIDQFSSNFSWTDMYNKLKGKITIAAKDLQFGADNITWTLLSNWIIQRPYQGASTEKVLEFNSSTGDLKIKGKILPGSSMGDNITINNNQYIVVGKTGDYKMEIYADETYGSSSIKSSGIRGKSSGTTVLDIGFLEAGNSVIPGISIGVNGPTYLRENSFSLACSSNSAYTLKITNTDKLKITCHPSNWLRESDALSGDVYVDSNGYLKLKGV